MRLLWNIVATFIFLLLANLCDERRVLGSPWPTARQEALDEEDDAEILKAVIDSMEAWRRRARTRAAHRTTRAAPGVCYEEVGCFDVSGVFGYLDMLPSPPAEVGTRFLVTAPAGTPRALDAALEVPFTNVSAMAAAVGDAINASAPTKVIVHGFGSSCDHVWVYEMRAALMSVEPCNVICVDWHPGASVPNYVRAAANARLVGKQLALLLSGLHVDHHVAFQAVHVIGFSLGAHVAGFAGAELGALSRITGLDPAGPLFESQDPRARLDSSDALFVDVIHSNGENLILGGLGSWQAMGHVDFYPNGGRMQKGCSNLFLGAVTDIIWASEVEGRSLCNHRRAYKFFTDSVSPRCHFPAFPCTTYEDFLRGRCFPCTGGRQCGAMGYYADRAAGRGSLYLLTREEEPFCAHQYHVTVDSALTPNNEFTYGKIVLTLIGQSQLNESFPLTQKDDEHITSGQALSRLLVPHPVLEEPTHVEIVYTAYDGWWSNGLDTWPVTRVWLVDSFGKSLSVCTKSLPLKSGLPVTLPLYPGECHVPSEDGNGTSVAAQLPPSSSLDNNGRNNSVRYIPTPVVHIGDEVIGEVEGEGHLEDPLSLLTAPDWEPVHYHDGGNNGLDDPRSLTATVTDNNGTSVVVANNDTASIVAERGNNETDELFHPLETVGGVVLSTLRNNGSVVDNATIEEPVLKNPKSNPLSVINDESVHRPSSVRIREVRIPSRADREDENRLWIPSRNLNPPNFGISQAWKTWNTAGNGENGTTTIAATMAKTGRRMLQPITIQLLPQRLANFLAQAERYARMAFQQSTSALLTPSVSPPSSSASALLTPSLSPPSSSPPPALLTPSLSPPSSASALSPPSSSALLPRNDDYPKQRRPKQFTTTMRTTMLNNAMLQSRSDTNHQPNNVKILVPFTYSYRGGQQSDRQVQYIPVLFPAMDDAGSDKSAKLITITPEQMKKSFRTVKIERNTSRFTAGVDLTHLHPVYPR